jgi:hypothetical protein
MAYYRYVDNILIIFVQHKTNIEQTLEEFNNIHDCKGTRKYKLFRHNNTPKKYGNFQYTENQKNKHHNT